MVPVPHCRVPGMHVACVRRLTAQGHDNFGGPMRQMPCPHVDTERDNCAANTDKVYMRDWKHVVAKHRTDGRRDEF